MEGKKVIVVLLILAVLGTAIGSAAMAAPKVSKNSSKTELTMLDPFTLRTLKVTNPRAIEAQLTRRPIRIPARPQARSAFRPQWPYR